MPDCFIPKYKIHDIGDIQTLSQIYPQNVKELDVPKLWKKTKGKGATVLVLDTGCPKNHPDLMNNVDITKCYSFIPGENIYDEYVGHGTHTSGTIGAVDNTEGIVGIAPEATIVTGKVLSKNGRSVGTSIEQGLRYALDLKPDVVNLSLGGPNPMPNAHKIIQQLVAQDIAVVCSAGNNGKDNILYPARYDECITVGSYSTSIMKDRSLFSSYGDALDIMAPGEEILSTYLNGSYSVMSGTSMAAPVISGIVALIKSYYKANNKTITVNQIKDLLYRNAKDIGSKGKDSQSGWGIINPENVLGPNSIEIVKIVNSEPSRCPLFDSIKSLFGKWFKR